MKVNEIIHCIERNQMKIKMLIFFSVFLLLKVNAQNSISGRVFDSETHQALPGVNVVVNELSMGTVSANDGTYLLKNLPKGTLLISYSYVGYETFTKKVVLQNEAIQVNVQLKPMVIQGQEVVISGSFAGTQHENTIKINSISTKDITRNVQASFIGSLADVPGVSVVSKGPGVATPVIRGLSLSNVLMLNNGIPMQNFQFSQDHPYLVDGSGLSRIEVIKGPASLMYGSGAVGGVINLIAEPVAPEGRVEGEFSTKLYSNTLGTTSELGLKGNQNGFVWGVNAALNSHEDYQQGNGLPAYNTRFNANSLKLNTGLIKKIGSFRLFYNYNRSKLGMAVPPALALVNETGRKNSVWYQDLTDQLLISKNKIFLGNLKINADFSYQNNNRRLQGSALTPVRELVDMTLKTFNYRLKGIYNFSENTKAFLGIQGMSQNNKNHQAPEHVIPDAQLNDFSVFSMLHQQFSPVFIAEAGFRYDHRNVNVPAAENVTAVHRNFNNLSASLGTNLHFSQSVLLRFNLASAFRSPNIAELTQNGLHGNRYEIGNASLNNQRNLEADLGLHIHTRHTTFEISAFYNHIYDYIYLSPTNETREGYAVYRYLQTPSQLYGGEAGIHVHPHPWDWLHIKANYSYIIGEKISGGYLPLIPANKIHFEVMAKKNHWKSTRNLFAKVWVDYAFAQRNPSEFESVSDDYTLLNAALGTDISFHGQLIQFSLTASNILDTLYMDHLSTLKDVGIYNMGRNIALNIRIPFGIKK
jgi:iron complex outermembrane receptor protein